MLHQARFDEMKEKLHVIKGLYKSRHYTQCAKFGEGVLSEVKDQLHPMHLAYLHFYVAISHDTLAREATLKNRYTELTLAEQHYTAAITTLRSTGTQTTDDEGLSSPASIISQDNCFGKRRSSNAGSFDSTTSATSSATSFGLDDHSSDADLVPKQLLHSPYLSQARIFSDTVPIKLKLVTRQLDITARFPRPSRHCTPQESHFLASTTSFIAMLNSHLSSVRELKAKTGVQGVRFRFPPPIALPTMIATAVVPSKQRGSHVYDNAEAEAVRRKRKEKVWRPRFDPEAVRRLCRDALAEVA